MNWRLGNLLSRMGLLSVLAMAIAVETAGVMAVWAAADSHGDAIKEACLATTYPDLCVLELRPFAGLVSRSRDPKKEIMKASVLVALENSRKLASLARQLRRHQLRGHQKEAQVKGPSGARSAIADCAEVLDDARSLVHDSLATLKHLREGNILSQISDAQTWLSAALTNDDTCLDGLRELGKVKSPLYIFLSKRVKRASSLISVSLALVNNYSTSLDL